MQAESQDKERPPKQELKVVNMVQGDYMVHVYIQTGKTFLLDTETTVNPYIQIETLNTTQYSKSKEDVACGTKTNIAWREHLYFEGRNLRQADIQEQTLNIKVKNKSFLKDQLIGMYEFDLTKIYGQEGHMVEHQNVALCNPESDDFNKVVGFIKISVAVQGPGDDTKKLDDQQGPDKDDQQILMPSQVKKEFKQLKIRFIQAIDLPKMDTFGTIDAYLYLKYLGIEYQTEVVTADELTKIAPIEQEIWLPIATPLTMDRLVLKLYDHDTAQFDDFIGSIQFSLKDLIQKGEKPGGHFYWQNLYGAPGKLNNAMAVMMKENPEYASTWKGRILMQIEATNEKFPQRGVFPLSEADNIKQLAEAQGYFQKRDYQICIEVSQGIALPFENKFTIKVKIGEHEWLSPPPLQSTPGCYNRWSWRLQPENRKFQSYFQSIEAMGKILVYLMDGEKPVCFWKGNCVDFTDPNPQMTFQAFKADRALGKVTQDHNAGMIGLKIAINNVSVNGPIRFEDYPAWSTKPPKRLVSHKIRCYIFQCRDIPAADDDGSTDCFITVWNQDNLKLQTRVIEDTLNPILYETIEMAYDMESIEKSPPIIFNIMDKDTFGSDYLGRAVIYPQDASTNLKLDEPNVEKRDNTIPKPIWHDIRMGFDAASPATGQVLCSFSIVPLDFDFNIPVSYLKLADTIPHKNYNVQIHIIGLRDLASAGLLPVKKPTVKLMLRSLVPPEKSQAVTNVTTEAGPSGSNPNINTSVNFELKLPVEELFCNSLACCVYDNVFGGFSQPTLGTFSIQIGQIKAQMEEHQENILNQCKVVLAEVQQMAGKGKNEMLRLIDQTIQAKIQKIQIEQQFEKRKELKLQAERASQIEKQNSLSKIRSVSNLSKKSSLTKQQFSVAKSNKSNQSYIQLVDEEDLRLIPQDKEKSPVNENQFNQKSYFQMQDDEEARSQIQTPNRGDRSPIRSKTFTEGSKHQLSRIRSKQLLETKEQKQAAKQEKSEFMKNTNALKQQEKELRKAQSEREQRQLNMTGGAQANIVMPDYVFDEQLKMYDENIKTIPSQKLYHKIGFNDRERIGEMMYGNDADKREELIINQEREKNQFETDRQLAYEEKTKKRHFEKTQMHYRRFYEDELENNKDLVGKSPFNKIDIKRGQSRGNSKSFFGALFSSDREDASGEVTTEKTVGYFKGLVDVYNTADRDKFQQELSHYKLQIFQHLKEIHNLIDKKFDFELEDLNEREKAANFIASIGQLGFEPIQMDHLKEFFQGQANEADLKRELVVITSCEVNLYLLEGFDFASRDGVGCFSDPYVVISCGTKTFNERDKYQTDEPNPKFYEMYKFTSDFPGSMPIVIEAYDYDDLFGDDIIGRTVIDLDDRFFNPKWRSIAHQPIEYRELYHQSTSRSQGTVTCWVEIDPQNKQNKEPKKEWDVDPEPVKDYELRVCILDAIDLPSEAEIDAASDPTKKVDNKTEKGASDVYITGYLEDQHKQKTDTHFRCTGEGSWNYRFVFRAKAPRKDHFLVLQAWDFDLLSSNDYICEWTLNVEPLFYFVQKTQQPLNFTKKFFEKAKERMLVYEREKGQESCDIEWYDENSFYLISHLNDKPIKLRIDVRMVPGAFADSNSLGHGRTQANMDPVLPPPTGRISFGLDMCKHIKTMVGPTVLRNCCIMGCCFLCFMLIVVSLPMILSDFFSKVIIQPMIGLADFSDSDLDEVVRTVGNA